MTIARVLPIKSRRSKGLTRSLQALVAASAALIPLASAWAGPLDAYLPKSGKIVGHVMRLGVAPEDQVIDRQFRIAVQNNMDWFKKYVTGQKSGAPLPYDHRMGITEAQYAKLQHMKADFQPGETIEIEVGRSADGRVTFGSKDGKAAELSKVAFPPDDKVAETPFGKLDIVNEIHQKDARAPIGLWDGIEWAHLQPSGADDKPSAKIAFGKRLPSGEGVLYYQVASYKDHPEQSLVVFYKLD